MSYRVVQWATGAVGTWSMRQIIDRPELELAGVWVSGPAKDGKDAGELCGGPATGVVATSSKAAIAELEADVVIHCPAAIGPEGALPFDDDVAMLLTSGKNVISSLSYYSPLIEGAERMETLRNACEQGGSTLYGCGLDPGYICDRVPAALTSGLADVTRIRMSESIDVSTHPGAQLMMDLGFGKRPEDLALDSPQVQYFALRAFPGAVAKLGDLLGAKLDGVQLGGIPELAFASKDLDLPMGRVQAGTISGIRYEYVGTRDGEPFISHEWVHYIERDGVPESWMKAPPQTPGEAMPYRVTLEIEGRPSVRTDIVFTDVEDAVFLPTAAACVRAIPYVCAAPPGFLRESVFGAWSPADRLAPVG
jgi:2,4-diaminopentanoate dehydrogenase